MSERKTTSGFSNFFILSDEVRKQLPMLTDCEVRHIQNLYLQFGEKLTMFELQNYNNIYQSQMWKQQISKSLIFTGESNQNILDENIVKFAQLLVTNYSAYSTSTVL